MEPEVRERFERVESNLAKVVDVVAKIAEMQAGAQGQINRIFVSHAEIQEEISALSRMMDEWIRSNPNNGRKPS